MSTPATDAVHAQMVDHLLIDRYGDFVLTDAIRPSPEKQVIPRQGYRIENFRDSDRQIQVPVLAASVSRDVLFEAFISLLDPLGGVVDVVLETSHDSDGTRHQDLFREGIDLPILQSHCYDFEDLLLNDGCTGVAVLSREGAMEVQFDEHKLLVVYAADLRPFVRILEELGVKRDDSMKLITEGEHLHSTDARYRRDFEQFCYRMGVGETAQPVSW
jgi:hypothetical protein